jgi:hypothetical protein
MWRSSTVAWGVLVVITGLAVLAQASPPRDPLPPPLYSFDLESPKVESGIVAADAVLVLDFPDPQTLYPGWMLGLGRPGDDLDALSRYDTVIAPNESFALLFSVDRNTVGVAAPDPHLVFRGVPYNVLDQAARGHAAGDQFMSTTLFTRSGTRNKILALLPNSVLVRNNFDEGGTDFVASPPVSAYEAVENEPQDEVDATAALPRQGGQEPNLLYFSVSAGSPSLEFMPGSQPPSGAHIFLFLPDQEVSTLFASFSDLGLQQDDDIDALIVFDADADGVFSGFDQVLFSLTPGSPSLSTISGASATGAAADVFSVTPGQPPVVFASAADLGLGDAQDNVDALGYTLHNDPEAGAAAHGIRSNSIPVLSEWGVLAMMLLLVMGGTIILSRRRRTFRSVDLAGN